MFLVKIIFWLLVFFIFYSYLGYGIFLFILVSVKRMFSSGRKKDEEFFEPEVTIFVPAFNEKDFVETKVENTLSLDYPKEKIEYIWVTDGSDDGTPDLLSKYNFIKVYHQSERNGKIGAMNKGIHFVTIPIVIFTDSNTTLCPYAIKEIVRLFRDNMFGFLSG